MGLIKAASSEREVIIAWLRAGAGDDDPAIRVIAETFADAIEQDEHMQWAEANAMRQGPQRGKLPS